MTPPTTQTGRGTLEDPEVLQNVPGHVIPILEREFDDFSTEAGRFMAGQVAEDEFIKFRLRQGVYGQRQPDVQMIRVKLPFGGVTPEQLDAFASVIERYAPLRKGHVTTRQCIQIHHIPLPEMEPLMREISEAGLSSREGCGNTVRNVTADPWAGVATDELFDITPYAAAYARYFVRHPTTQAMPRKVKTAFDGSPQDRAISTIHDIAFRARVREIPGRGEVRGVEILVGGGTSIMPRTAKVLSEFAELENGEYLRIAEAVFRIFDRQDWLRVNRARARIKVFVDKYGIDELRRQVDEELTGDWVAERDFSIEPLLFEDDEQASAPAPRPGAPAVPNGDLRDYDQFAAANVRPQRQDGFVTVEVRIPAATSSPSSCAGSPRSCANTPGATPARRSSRTCCCAGCAPRPHTRSTARSARWASTRRARARSPTSSPAPAPTPASSGSRARWGSTARSRSASRHWTCATSWCARCRSG